MIANRKEISRVFYLHILELLCPGTQFWCLPDNRASHASEHELAYLFYLAGHNKPACGFGRDCSHKPAMCRHIIEFYAPNADSSSITKHNLLHEQLHRNAEPTVRTVDDQTQ